MNGTVELKTERLVLRRHTSDDAEKPDELCAEFLRNDS